MVGVWWENFDDRRKPAGARDRILRMLHKYYVSRLVHALICLIVNHPHDILGTLVTLS